MDPDKVMEQNTAASAATSTTSPPTESGKTEAPDFAKLADSFMMDDDPGSVPEAPPSSSSSEASPAPPSPEAPTPGAVPSSAAEPAPASTATPVPAAATPPVVEQPPVSSQPAVEPAQPAATPPAPVDFKQVREKSIAELEKFYELPQEEAAGLVDEGLAKILPKQFARLHFETQAGIFSAITEQLPVLIQTVLAQRDAEMQFKESFYKEWPELRGKDEQTITSTLMAYRQVNPKADLNALIKQAGALAMLQFGLDPIASRQKTPAAPTPPPAPSVIHVPAGTASAGVGPGIAAPNGQGGNFFGELASQWRDEEMNG